MYDGIIAPRVIDGSINGESFRTYVEQALVPELRPDDIVVMDHLGSHKAPAIRAAGAELFYLPAYSPDLNPIEQVIAKLKQELVQEFRVKGVTLRATEQPVDTSMAAGKAFFDVLGVFAEFGTNLRREREMEEIAAAKARGVYRGRMPKIDPEEV